MIYLENIRNIFSEVVGEEAAELVTLDASMEDIPGWDSLTFVKIIMRLEEKFELRISSADATSLFSISAINEFLENKVKSKEKD